MDITIEIPVRSTEVDFLGHVNNAKYLEYMEWGREAWYSQAGCSFEQLAKRGMGPVTVNINIDYLGECRQGDLLLVKTSPFKTGNSSYVMKQQIFKTTSMEKVSEAYITAVVIDLNTRKSIPIPAELKEHLV